MRQQLRDLAIACCIVLSFATPTAAQPAAESTATAVSSAAVGHAAAAEIGSGPLALAWFAAFAIFAFAVRRAMRLPAR